MSDSPKKPSNDGMNPQLADLFRRLSKVTLPMAPDEVETEQGSNDGGIKDTQNSLSSSASNHIAKNDPN